MSRLIAAAMLLIASLGCEAEVADTEPPCDPACQAGAVCVEGTCTVLDGSFIAVIEPFEGAQEIVPLDGIGPTRPTLVRLPEDCDVETEVRLRARTSSAGGSRDELAADLRFFRRGFPSRRYAGMTNALPDAAFPSTGPGSDRRVAHIRLSRGQVYDVFVSPQASTPPALFERLSVATCPSEQTFELFPARRISGTVVDALDGSVVQPDVDVWAVGPAGLRSPVVRTDEAGRFTLDLPRKQEAFMRPELPPVRFELRARRTSELTEGGLPSWRFRGTIDFEEGEAQIDGYELRLEPTLDSLRVGAQIQLRGRSPNGLELPVVSGAELSWSLVSSSTNTAVFSGAGVSGEQGLVQTILPDGRLVGATDPIPILSGRLSFDVRTPAGSIFSDAVLEAPLSRTSPLPLQLELTRRRPRVRGRVVDLRQSPVARALLRLEDLSGRRFSALTGEDGRFDVPVEPGRYGLSIEAPDGRGLTYRVVEIDEDGLELGTLRPPSTVPVELLVERFDGSPAVSSDVWVYLRIAPEDPPILVGRGRSDAQGRVPLRLPLRSADPD